MLSTTTMPSIPVDVLRHILGHADQATLAKVCLLNKICCSCSQDILYRHIRITEYLEGTKICRTLGQSTHLARRVRSFVISSHVYVKRHERELREALQNMTYLRNLSFRCTTNFSVLDGCTFKLSSFTCSPLHHQPLHGFLLDQPSLTNVRLTPLHDPPVFEETCLPNLTLVTTVFHWLTQLVPNRPVKEVVSLGVIPIGDSVDLSFLALSTSPIQKLTIHYSILYPNPGQFLASVCPSLTHLKIDADLIYSIVCELPSLLA